MWARAASTSAGVTALAVSSSSVVSRESMSTPKVRIHCDGSATPHVCPMPRPPNAPHGAHVQPVDHRAGAAVRPDPLDRARVVVAPVDEAVGDADLLEAAVHHQPADGPPPLRARVRPQHDPLAGRGEVAQRGHQVRRPHPRPGEEDDRVQVIHLLELVQARLRLGLGGQDDVVLDQLDVGCAQGRFRLRDQGVVDERCPHRIEQPVLVDAEDDEGDFGISA